MEKKDILEIIEGCKRLDPSCQKELVRRFASLLMTTAMRYSRDVPSAEDLVQETFIKIFRHIPEYDPVLGNFPMWIRRILINTALSKLRKTYLKQEAHHPTLPYEPDIAPDVFSKLNMDLLIRLISELPEGYKQVFNLYVFDGFRHEEISRMLGIQEETSRSQLFRARKILQEKIVKLYPNEVARI